MTIDNLFIAVLTGLTILTMLMMIRVFKGPTVYDRLNGLAVIGTNVILILTVSGFISGRVEMYVDIAITYAILGFIGLVVIAKYLEGEGNGKG